MKWTIRCNASIRCGVGALLLVTSGLTGATPVVLYNGTGEATGISDLVVAGTNYDVSFVFGSYNAVYGGGTPTFLGNGAGAEAASDALGAALNGETVSPVVGNGGPRGVLWVPFATSGGSFLASQVAYQPSPWKRFSDFTGSVATDFSAENWGFATFTPDLPEPATLSLFGLGLAAIGLMRRRKAA